ncbi:MAG: hypothetical protein JXA21_30080 [Anaerolineae bacterium]|nr:hypothetical protein [Anaerolineae bacterium]
MLHAKLAEELSVLLYTTFNSVTRLYLNAMFTPPSDMTRQSNGETLVFGQ